nr:reverse transcriptase domain-containing protein [Tanacetum cinerariifolium]
MASFDYHLNPLYLVKECSSCGAWYTTDYCCSGGSLGDKIICDLDKTSDLSQRSLQNCPKCGNPVDGHYCQVCALLRKKFKEDLFTYCINNGILQDSSKPSNDNTNVVNALQEPFVVNQDPGKNSSQSPPQINHHCCYECGDPLEDIFCHICTCELCGREDPHAHIYYFNKITSTLTFPNAPNTSIKLMLFSFSLEGAARIWLQKEPPRSIFTWDDLVSKFINQFFTPSKTTSLRNEITNFQQQFDESFSEAWDRFKDHLRACPHHGFLELHQLDAFYNALNSKDQDSLNSAAGVSTNASTSGVSPDVAELKDMVRALLLDKKGQNQSSAPVKAVEESCVTCGGAPSYRNFPATDGNVYRDNIQEYVSQASAVNYNQGNTGYRPQMMSNQIQPRGFPPVPNNQNVQRNNQNHFIPNQNRGNTFNQGHVYQPSVFQQPAYQAPAYQAPAPQTHGVSKKDFSAYVKANDAVMKNMQTQGQNMQNQLTNLTDLITKFVNSNTASTSSSGTLPSNTIANPKSDLKAITTRNGLSYDGPQIPPLVVEMNLRLQRTQDPGKFLIPCDFPSMAECLALADLDASINLMPYSVWKRLSLPDLTPTCMTLEQADRSISRPVRVAEDVYVKVGSFHFSAYFIVVDFDADPRVPLILRISFLKTGKALIDVFEDELTLRVGKEFITFNLDQTSRYSDNYSDMTGKRIDVIDMAYRDILLLEAFLNDDPSSPPQNQRNYQPEVRKELKIYEAKTDKSSVDKPPVVELKALPPHLKYAFLEGDDKLPVIIIKDLSVEENTALITVLKSHKRAIAWKLSDINEVIKLLDAGLIYPVSDSPWVSPVHCVPKKGGITVVENEDNELIPTRLVMGWHVCIDYCKLNEATRKDHFPLPFMDQVLERLAGNQYYCFLDVFSGYFQIPIDPKDQKKTTFPYPYGTFAYRRMPFGLRNAQGTF